VQSLFSSIVFLSLEHLSYRLYGRVGGVVKNWKGVEVLQDRWIPGTKYREASESSVVSTNSERV